ncbi:MAG: DoxX family protein [Sphingobacteriales bacterium 17-39-43]|uniref:BT_3928 family protein n=1 Tax=Daejeonella sp. TaxID=2805397 RepID=UPI000BD34D28|nr:BT_3928 family protein [Daejeonella sp.]OYX93771.1 MAG: DoxX family protein [Sphingobacteriia bacterium 35-40-5]OYZ31512.1 MAG: DoxX family protein [Sphingobacteriales bacterium 16-39-50]OZA24682.1 MAG: DoxX family protein [Sphingobacteriales bacterium 17-39-43]HQT22677.1 DoxX family protein [Daejeonella sp.]HQT57633.1 DoxX family protein [Daejeonella sp.]
MKHALLHLLRAIVGLLFIFSGLIKANDPLGFGYKLQEYFEVFHIAFLNDYATVFAILLCTIEIVLGALLLLGIRSRNVASGLLLTIIFFTFLTFYSAFFEVVTSCGCFGDAIPLTPWQSFSKDIVLLIMILYIYKKRNEIMPLISSERAQNWILGFILLISLGFGLYTYSFLPILDFLPYKIGNNIPSLMIMPPGAPQDVYQITYTLKNKSTGETKSLTDKEYLSSGIWKDKNWEITGDPESKLISKGFEVKIKDLKITDSQGTDYNAEILENPYYNLVIVAYDLSKTDLIGIGNLNALAINAAENFNIRTVFLTSNSAQDAEAFSKKNKLVMEIFYADAIPLKSMVRANPGVLLLKNGTVINKWHFRNLPDYDELVGKYFRGE